MKQSVSNAAVCAANIQAASNAIMRLASGMASIHSIIHAADSGSDISRQADEARNLINTTAYQVELASQLGMDVSVLMSEVCPPDVLDKSADINSAINNVLTQVTTEYNAVSKLAIAAIG